MANKSHYVASIEIKNVYLTCNQTLICPSPRLSKPQKPQDLPLTPNLILLNFKKNSILRTAANNLNRKTFWRFRTVNETVSSIRRVISIQVRSLATLLANYKWVKIMLFTLTKLIRKIYQEMQKYWKLTMTQQSRCKNHTL